MQYTSFFIMREEGPNFLAGAKCQSSLFCVTTRRLRTVRFNQTRPPTVPVIRIPIYSASPKGQTDLSDPLLLPTLSHQMLLKRSWPRASAGLPIGLDIAVLCFCFQGSVASDLTARLEYSSSSSGLLFINCRWPHPVS